MNAKLKKAVDVALKWDRGEMNPAVQPNTRVSVSRPLINIYSMQVCAVDDATDEEILECCNRDNPSGTSAGWTQVVRDPKKHDLPDATKPGPCEDAPGRTHFIVLC